MTTLFSQSPNAVNVVKLRHYIFDFLNVLQIIVESK